MTSMATNTDTEETATTATTATTAATAGTFPSNWRIAADYDPNDHLLSLKGQAYLGVQQRVLWFIRDQRELTMRGLARVPYVVRTELVEIDRERGFAHFRTYVRDVLGNEATMYGSETSKDFGDYAEKASTKSLGRALMALGYGTAFAPEMDEGERVVDSPVTPVEHRSVRVPQRPQPGNTTNAPTPIRPRQNAPQSAQAAQPAQFATATAERPATAQQVASINKLCAALGKPPMTSALTYDEARLVLATLSKEYGEMKAKERA